MNKKGVVGILIVVIILVGVVAVGYTIFKPSPSPSPTGAAVSLNSNSNTNYNPNNPAGIPEYKNTGKGDYGQVCLDEGYCDSGECQGGMCVHCGYFGETCCYQDVAGDACRDSGTECYLGRCRATNEYTQDCGHVGYKPCYYNEYAKCYYGVYNSDRDICEACGDYEQPCCLVDAPYDCDYGKCAYGICKRVDNQASSSSAAPAASSGPNPQDYPIDDSSSAVDSTNCGYLNEPCCPQSLDALSPTAVYSSQPKCYSGLECYGDVCVNGPEYETYQR